MTQTVTNTTARSDFPLIVETSIQKIKHIATLPGVALKIMELTKDPESTAEDVNKIIKSDPALSTRILKVVNSSFYGLPRQIASIHHAVVLLGMNAVKNIAITASLHKVFQSEQIGPDFDARDLWSHSVAVATGAHGIAIKAELGFLDEAFLAGLIHDIGIMVEMQTCRQKFVEMINILSDDQSLTFRQAEEQLLGATHESFGAALCRKWKFPVHLEHVAGCHHQPMQLPEADRTLPAIVHVADVLAARIGAGYTRTVETKAVDPEVLSLLNLGESDMEALAESLPDAIEEAQQLLSGSGTG